MLKKCVSILLFCLCWLFGAWEQQCTEQTWTGLHPKLQPWAPGQHRRAGAAGPWGFCSSCSLLRLCSNMRWVMVSQASLLFGRQNQEPLSGRVSSCTPYHPAQLHPPPWKTLPTMSFHGELKNPLVGLCICWPLCSLWTSVFSKRDSTIVFLGLTYTSLPYVPQYQSSASHRWTPRISCPTPMPQIYLSVMQLELMWLHHHKTSVTENQPKEVPIHLHVHSDIIRLSWF